MTTTYTYKLSNGLEILLIIDPSANRTACSLDFFTGSMNDPENSSGLSHLIEHLISSRFSYGRLGLFNASTGYEHSNFRFETDHVSFIKSLKIFVDAFNNPFIDNYNLDSEKKIINSEFEKNSYDQGILKAHIFNITNTKGHPLSKFHYGNYNSLKDLGLEDIKMFFTTHYGSTNAKLAISTALNYKEVHKSIEEIFNDFRTVPIKKTQTRGKIFKGLTLPLITKASLDDSLTLCFEIDRIYDNYRTKPHWILNYLINSKRAGSLYKILKNRGLATDIFSSIQPFSFSSLLFVEIKPTAKGVLEYKEILSEFFSYIELVNQQGYPEYLFNEQRAISLLGFKYREHSDGMNVVKDLSRLMHYYPAKDAVTFNDLIFDYSQKDFEKILSQIDPKNMRVLLCSYGIDSSNIDEYYGIAYETQKLDLNFKKEKSNFKYPEANRFIMEAPLIYYDDIKNNEPYLLINDQKGKAWFLQDNFLKLPMLYVNLMILTTEVNKDPYSKLLSIIYSRLVLQELEDVLDEAGDAGLTFGIERDDKGVSLFFSGYSEKMPELIQEVISNLKIKNIDTNTLDSVKNELKDDYNSLMKGSSLTLAQYYKHQLLHKNSIPFNAYIDRINDVSAEDLILFMDRIYKNIFLESHIFGNTSPVTVNNIYNFIFTKLNAEYLSEKQRPKDDIVSYSKNGSVDYFLDTDSEDHCWSSFYEFGSRTTRLSAIIQLANMFLAPYFFENIRVKKQLGYLAETRVEFFEDVLGLSFVVLSDETIPEELEKHSEQVMESFPEYLLSIPEKDFENKKRVLIERVNKNNRTLEDWMNDIVLTSVFKGDTKYAEKLSKEISSLSREELATVFRHAFNPSTRARLSIYTR